MNTTKYMIASLIQICKQNAAVGVQRSRQLSSSTHRTNNTFYELRTYAVQPGAFPDFLKLTSEMMHLRLAHSKLIGYWIADLGALNQAVHIWEYDSFAQRKTVRANLSVDQNWLNSYLLKMLKMLSWQENATIYQMPWCQVESEPCKQGGVYELKETVMKPGGPVKWGEAVKASVLTEAQAHKEHGFGKLMGIWSGDFGKSSSLYQLWNFESLDHRAEQKAHIETLPEVQQTSAAVEDFMTEHVTSKALIPTVFSPLK